MVDDSLGEARQSAVDAAREFIRAAAHPISPLEAQAASSAALKALQHLTVLAAAVARYSSTPQ